MRQVLFSLFHLTLESLLLSQCGYPFSWTNPHMLWLRFHSWSCTRKTLKNWSRAFRTRKLAANICSTCAGLKVFGARFAAMMVPGLSGKVCLNAQSAGGRHR